MTHVNRSDITLTEYREMSFTFDTAVEEATTYWTAELDGDLSTGEHVNLSRWHGTRKEAQRLLEEAITEQGWEIR